MKPILIVKSDAILHMEANGLHVFYRPILIPGDVEARTGADAQGHIASQETVNAFVEKYSGQELRLDLNHQTAPVASVMATVVQPDTDIETPAGPIKAGSAIAKIETEDPLVAAFLDKHLNGVSLFGKANLRPLDEVEQADGEEAVDDEEDGSGDEGDDDKKAKVERPRIVRAADDTKATKATKADDSLPGFELAKALKDSGGLEAVAKAAIDPAAVSGNIWFNGTDEQRAGFSGGTAGRSRDERPPKEWWDDCMAQTAKATKKG